MSHFIIHFSGLGEIVYKRTYSRLKADDANEEWYETVARCINGAQEIGAMYTVEEAERLYDHVFNLRCNFAGRMLWQLGTGNWKRYGANAYLNCWFRLMNTPESFCFLFENSMLGGGVGYSVRREDVFELPKIHENVKITHTNTKDAGFIVPDSREGWINLLRKVMRSYFTNGKSFSYSTILVRSYGEKINGFGGTASGPGILVDGITNICKVMEGRAGKKLRSIDVLDICNIIGSIVVAGNVRRCLPEYSLVHCKDGLKQIKDVTVGEEVLTITGYQKVLNKFVQGKQDTVFVYTQDGVLECTKNHKIAVLNSVNSYEWVEAGKLKSGDRIISSRTNIDGIDTVLPNWTYVKSAITLLLMLNDLNYL